MSKLVFSVGLRIPGNVTEYVPLRSDKSLFDADIVIFSPSLDDYYGHESYAGKTLLSDTSSSHIARDFAHWRRELRSAVDAGKVVYIYLSKPESVYYYTGSKEFSGTGRSRVITNHVAEIESYSAIPVSFTGLTPRSGTRIAPIGNLGPVAAYWHEFGSLSSFQAYYESGNGIDILGTNKREKIVGSLIKSNQGGALVLLPPVLWDEDELTYTRGDKTFWRKEATQLGTKLVSALVAASDSIRKSGQSSPKPEWLASPVFSLKPVEACEQKIQVIEEKIQELSVQRKDLEAEMEEARLLQGLLYETGKPLEDAIIKALRILGFEADNYTDTESEFDAIIKSHEGRFLGEAEGKDNKAINIEKMSQLERNIQEDFSRDDIDEYAKGILFGNAYRFKPLSERNEYFTAKCIAAAKRLGTALVRTPDLFAIAKYISESQDLSYATICRKKMLDTSGEVVVFPQIPDLQGEK